MARAGRLWRGLPRLFQRPRDGIGGTAAVDPALSADGGLRQVGAGEDIAARSGAVPVVAGRALLAGLFASGFFRWVEGAAGAGDAQLAGRAPLRGSSVPGACARAES